jgi:hypothetical protein
MPNNDATKYTDEEIITLLKDDKLANLTIEQEAGQRWEVQKLETAKLQDKVTELSTEFDSTGINKVSFDIQSELLIECPVFGRIFQRIEEIAPSLKDVLDGNFFVLDCNNQAIKCRHKFKILKNQSGGLVFGIDLPVILPVDSVQVIVPNII